MFNKLKTFSVNRMFANLKYENILINIMIIKLKSV